MYESEAQTDVPALARIGGSGPGRREISLRVKDEIKHLEEALSRKKRLAQLLDENPAIREALDLLNS
jgi:hypothetical protein